MEYLKGQLLIAAPQLTDPNFNRTVVLMIEHDENGAFGVVLNRPTDKTIEDAWHEVDAEPCHCLKTIHVGGPVMGPLLAIHTCDRLAEAEIMPGVFLATQRDHIDELVRQHDEPFQLYSGYAGWGKGQLEGELEQGGWITREAKCDHIFEEDDEDGLWERVGKEITEDVLGGALNIRHFPDDPSLN